MHPYRIYTVALSVFVALFSCNKEKAANTDNTDCFPDAITSRTIVNKQATIKSANGQFYLVEQGSIDTKLKPCNLPSEYKINNLSVTISGDVKATPQNTSEPCCTESLVITKITR